MSIREDIIAGTYYYGKMRHPYAVTWNGRAYHDFDTCDLVNQVIECELGFVEIAIKKLDAFNEDHAGELQELITYRDYLSAGIGK
jgi:hypothetical protein